MRTGSLCLIATLGLFACDGCGSSNPGAVTAPNITAPELHAVVTGRVKLAPGFELPAYPMAEMERKVLTHLTRGSWPEQCTPPKLSDRTPVTLTQEGFLHGVMVAASEFDGAVPRPPILHEVFIKDCRLTPSLIVAVKGDVVRLVNEVDFPFMPSFGPEAVVRTLSRGQFFEYELGQGDVESLRCGFTAPCGRTDVITVYHAVFDVTDATGVFKIDNFPPDQPVKVHAWHPLFEEIEVMLTLGQGEVRTIELVITPRARYVGGAAATADAGKATTSDAGAPEAPAAAKSALP